MDKRYIVLNSSGGGGSGTLDANYFKGQGERQGIEREYIVIYESRNVSKDQERTEQT